MYGQLKQSEDDSYLKSNSSFGMVASAYRGTAYSSDNSRYEKATLEKLLMIQNTMYQQNLAGLL